MDYALYSEFESRETLENYAVHPLHQEAKTHFFHLLDSRVAADYEYNPIFDSPVDGRRPQSRTEGEKR